MKQVVGRNDLPWARLRVEGAINRAECVVIVAGRDVARIPITSHYVRSQADDDPAVLGIETFCTEHGAAGGLPG